MTDSLNDLFGEFPGRPNVPEFWQLSEIILRMDGISEGDNSEEAFNKLLAEVIPAEVLSYMSAQRALHATMRTGIEPIHFAAMWLDGFMAGALYAKKYPKEVSDD